MPPRAALGAQGILVDVSDGARARANAMAGVLQDDIVGVNNACKHCRAGQPAQSSLSSRIHDDMAGCQRHEAKL